jgi:LysM repeat protein
VTDQKLFALGQSAGKSSCKQSHLRPAGKPVRPVQLRMMRTVAASICMSALLVTGCEYAAKPGEHVNVTPSAVASTFPSPAGVARSLKGKTELNKFFLATQYICVEGDTWETVAREFGIKAEILRTFNQSATLNAGVVVDLRGRDVPQPGAGGPFAPNPDGTASYIVTAEDTFSGISSRFGVPGHALRGANPSLRGNGAELLVAPGQNLTIPSTL